VTQRQNVDGSTQTQDTTLLTSLGHRHFPCFYSSIGVDCEKAKDP